MWLAESRTQAGPFARARWWPANGDQTVCMMAVQNDNSTFLHITENPLCTGGPRLIISRLGQGAVRAAVVAPAAAAVSAREPPPCPGREGERAPVGWVLRRSTPAPPPPASTARRCSAPRSCEGGCGADAPAGAARRPAAPPAPRSGRSSRLTAAPARAADAQTAAVAPRRPARASAARRASPPRRPTPASACSSCGSAALQRQVRPQSRLLRLGHQFYTPSGRSQAPNPTSPPPLRLAARGRPLARGRGARLKI